MGDEWVNKSAFHEGEVRHELVAVHDDVGVAENDDHLLSDQQDQDQPARNERDRLRNVIVVAGIILLGVPARRCTRSGRRTI